MRPTAMNLSRRQWLRFTASLAAASSLAPVLFASPEVSKQELTFSVATDAVWPLPQKEGDANKVTITLTVKNNSPKDLNVSLMDTLTPTVTFPDGKLQSLEMQRKRTALVPPLVLKAGKSESVAYAVRVYWTNRADGAAAAIADRSGGAWIIDNLPKGKYTLGFTYQNKELADHEGKALWVGQATVPATTFEAMP